MTLIAFLTVAAASVAFAVIVTVIGAGVYIVLASRKDDY